LFVVVVLLLENFSSFGLLLPPVLAGHEEDLKNAVVVEMFWKPNDLIS